MCGIAGILGIGKKSIHDTSVIKAMVEIQRHRGPDDQGILGIVGEDRVFKSFRTDVAEHIENICTALMGFARLSIRDLSVQGHQPMVDVSGRAAISFNGEIYNADEIRAELTAKGHVFRSTTDTEVILEAYLEYGFGETVRKLNGMFAIVIADLKRKLFYLARDRAGIKPLYYTVMDEWFIYASEIKGILQYPGMDRAISEEALYEKMMYRGATVPSLIKGIHWVEPGTYYTLGWDGECRKFPFFTINDYDRREEKDIVSDMKTLEEVMKQCVKRQMISDVKVGCQLSGGVDSSLVCLYAKKENPRFMNDTISVISPIPEFSEEYWIDEVNSRLGMKGHKFLLDVDRVMDTLPMTIWHLETMLTQPNSLGILQISEHAREFVTVLLSGEGADEMMGGYECWYEPLSFLWNFSKKRKDPGAFEDYVINMEIDTDMEWNRRLLPSFDPGTIMEQRRELFQKMQGDPFTKVMKYQFKTYLPELLLRQDKMSMANSVENRVPILDNEMIDFLFQIPVEEFVTGGWKLPGPANVLKNGRRAFWRAKCKFIFKELCAGHFGTDFAYRRKMGFPMPIISFMSGRLFKERFYGEWLPNISKRGIFNANEMKLLFEKQKKLSFHESETLWRALSFEMWCEAFVD